TFSRDESTWKLIKKIDSINLYLKKNDKKRIVSYFCVGKGQDLNNIIHELAYEPKYENVIDQLLPFKLWLSQKKFNKGSSSSLLNYIALFKIGHHDYFKELVIYWSKGRVVIKNISEQDILFLYDNNEYKISPKDFLTDLFGYPPIKEFEKFGKPLYLSGIDSV
ncbi:MAG: hypothetical protein OXB84_08675, partial [Halobacteriovoraceae bacterium]|nr:hypothetical protein [Halobacteriovoraceae bacterium]